jgi:hypothetical protein
MRLVEEKHQTRRASFGEPAKVEIFLLSQRHYYYHRLLCHSLVLSVRYAAFAKCLILIPLLEVICKDYSFVEADPKLQTSDNNPIILFFLLIRWAEQYGELGELLI